MYGEAKRRRVERCQRGRATYRERMHTSVSVRDGHFPNADVAEDVGEKLAEGQRYDEPQVIAPRYVGRVLPHAPQIEERARVNGDRGQLHHGHRERIRELRQQHLADDIAAAGHRVPQETQEQHRYNLAIVPSVVHDVSRESARYRATTRSLNSIS